MVSSHWVIPCSNTCSLHAASRNQDHFGRENWDHQLKLAVAWNRVDIARSEIFTDDHDWKVQPHLCCLVAQAYSLSGLWVWRALLTLAVPGESCKGISPGP